MVHLFRRGIAQAYYRTSLRQNIISDMQSYENLYRSSRNQITQFGLKRLASILSHATATVPYYRKLLGKSSIHENNVLDKLAQLPVLTKTIIRQQGSLLCSESIGSKPRENTSGGSTGEPVRLLQDREMARESRTGELLFMKWAGHRLGEPHVLIWGVPLSTFGRSVGWHEKLFRFAQNETYLNCHRITEAHFVDWVNTINRLQPVLIEAYVDVLREFAKWILDSGTHVTRPRGIITSAGVLTATARETITRVFGCPILNRYGSREVGNMACSCGQAEELHVHEAWCHLEIVDEHGKPCKVGEEGNILVTLYANRTMPMIRYQIEDRASWAQGTCKCGRLTKRLSEVAGRMNDYVVAADGARISGAALTTVLYGVRGIKRFQYRQSSLSSVNLSVESCSGVDTSRLKADLVEPVEKLESLLKGTKVEVVYSEEIQPSNSGKYRYIINDLASQ
jgi:phenylacetate-CoA ligase